MNKLEKETNRNGKGHKTEVERDKILGGILCILYRWEWKREHMGMGRLQHNVPTVDVSY